MSFLLLNILLAVVLPGCSLPAVVDSPPPSPPAFVADSSAIDTSRQSGAQLMLLPIIFSSPDTRLAAGVLPQLVFRTSSSSNPSSIRIDAYYTQNRQYHLLLRPTFWLRDNNLNLVGKFSTKKWPTSFYGIGNDSQEGDKEKFTETLYESSIEVLKSIRRRTGYFAGLSYSLRYGKIDPEDLMGRLASAEITGSSTSWTSSIGAILRQDTRDNHFYPTKGSYNTIEISSATKLLGSNNNFTRLTIDMRKYFPIYQAQVLALQVMGSFSYGKVPFRLLPSVGSTLRGYSTVRYIDKNMAAIQMEYRVAPLFWRLGFVAFAGLADVFDQPGDLQPGRLKYSGGIGIRYMFSRSEKINIRLDYGIGRDSSGDYLDLTEAF